MTHIYEECQYHLGRTVEIERHDGECVRGTLEDLDQEYAYVRVIDENPSVSGEGPFDGPGLFFWGAFAGGFAGGLLGVALGSICCVRPYGFGGYGFY